MILNINSKSAVNSTKRQYMTLNIDEQDNYKK